MVLRRRNSGERIDMGIGVRFGEHLREARSMELAWFIYPFSCCSGKIFCQVMYF